MYKTCASLFSGCGGWEGGAIRHGLEPLWGVDVDPRIARIWDMNFAHGDKKCVVSDVRNVDYASLPAPDVLFASPECKTESRARKETSLAPDPVIVCDPSLGAAVVYAVAALRPKLFLLEEVPDFKGSGAWKIIAAALVKMGYENLVFDDVVFGDYGVVQVRKRMVARARSDGPVLPLPPKLPRVSWWDLIRPMIESKQLPQEELSAWQERGLRLKPPTSWPVYVPGGNKRGSVVDPATGESVPWAWYGAGEKTRDGDPYPIPALTRAQSGGSARVKVGPNGPTYRITTQGYAVLQGFYPEHKFLSYTDADTARLLYSVIGAAVPPRVSYQLLKPYMAR